MRFDTCIIPRMMTRLVLPGVSMTVAIAARRCSFSRANRRPSYDSSLSKIAGTGAVGSRAGSAAAARIASYIWGLRPAIVTDYW